MMFIIIEYGCIILNYRIEIVKLIMQFIKFEGNKTFFLSIVIFFKENKLHLYFSIITNCYISHVWLTCSCFLNFFVLRFQESRAFTCTLCFKEEKEEQSCFVVLIPKFEFKSKIIHWLKKMVRIVPISKYLSN